MSKCTQDAHALTSSILIKGIEDEASIQLTPVGKPFLAGAEWNSGFHSFTVYGEGNREILWQVLADRDDPEIHELRRSVVEDKRQGKICNKGELLYPKAYGFPETMGRGYKERAEFEKYNKAISKP